MRKRLEKSNPSKYSNKDAIILNQKTQDRNTSNQPENKRENNHSESISDYLFDTNETQPKKPKLENRLNILNSSGPPPPLSFSPTFYPFPYQLFNMYTPFQIILPVQAPIQLPPTSVQSVIQSVHRLRQQHDMHGRF